jgi:hypothetical protein
MNIKKVFLAVLGLVLLTLMVPLPVFAEGNTFIAGDANGSGNVSIGDITFVERVMLGYNEPNLRCDANLDGDVNMGDVVRIERMILGLNVPITVDNMQKMILNLIPTDLAFDLNKDGQVSITDLTILENKISEMD